MLKSPATCPTSERAKYNRRINMPAKKALHFSVMDAFKVIFHTFKRCSMYNYQKRKKMSVPKQSNLFAFMTE